MHNYHTHHTQNLKNELSSVLEVLMLHNTSSSKIFGNESDVFEYENSRKEIQNLIQDDLSKDKELESHKKNYKNQIYELKKMLKDILNEKKMVTIGSDVDVKESVELEKVDTTTCTTTTTTTSNDTSPPSISPSPLSLHPSSSSNQSTPSQHHRFAPTSIFADVLLCVGSELYRDKNILEEEEKLLNADIKNHRKEVRMFYLTNYLSFIYFSICQCISLSLII